jgi:hypothetical protein
VLHRVLRPDDGDALNPPGTAVAFRRSCEGASDETVRRSLRTPGRRALPVRPRPRPRRRTRPTTA